MNLISYGRSDEGQKKDILQLQKDVNRFGSAAEEIPLIKLNIEYMKASQARTEANIKTILERENQ